MLCAVEGKVATIVEDGFTIAPERPRGTRKTDLPREVKVKTQIPGPQLSLRVGDQVSVAGGYGEDPDVFLSSHVTKFFRDGSTMQVHVNTFEAMFGPERITTPPPKRPWWRFW